MWMANLFASGCCCPATSGSPSANGKGNVAILRSDEMSSSKPLPKKPSSTPAVTFTICGSVTSPSGGTGFDWLESKTLRRILPSSRPNANSSWLLTLATARSMLSRTSAPLAMMRPVMYFKLPRCSRARRKASIASLLHLVMKPSAMRATPSRLRTSSPSCSAGGSCPMPPLLVNISSKTSTKFATIWLAPSYMSLTLSIRHSASARGSSRWWSRPSAMPSTMCTPCTERPVPAPS
mmetsp:Transcript_102463/g.319242  ORF Transcript_102463/g.319242 Transcript_102463/m.319242 type:complete len:236 (+) Transcript_102463:188-895(+)